MTGRMGKGGWITVGIALVAWATPPAAVSQVAGFFGGPNFGTLNDIETTSLSQAFDSRTGWHVGFFVDLGADAGGVRFSVNYLNVGSVFEGADFLAESGFDVFYLSFPVDVRYRLFNVAYIFAGPELRLLTSADAQADFDDDLKTLVINGGAGLGFKIGPILIEARRTFGLSGVTSRSFSVGSVTVATDDTRRFDSWRATVGLFVF